MHDSAVASATSAAACLRWSSAPWSGPSRRCRCVLVGIQNRSTIECLLSVGDPRRRCVTFQVVPEPLEDSPFIINLVLLLGKAVPLTGVDEQDDVLPCPAGIVVEERALPRVDGAVVRAFHEQH